MSGLKKLRADLVRREAEANDILIVNVQGHLMLLLSIVSALTMVIAVALLARIIETFTVNYLGGIAWSIVVISSGCVLILSIYLYWLGTQRLSV